MIPSVIFGSLSLSSFSSLSSLSPLSFIVELRSRRSVAVGERSPSPVGARVNTPGDCARVRFVFGDISKYFSSKVKLCFSWSYSPNELISPLLGSFSRFRCGHGMPSNPSWYQSQGFHGLNNDEKCDFSSYSVFRSFHGLAVILNFFTADYF